MYQRTKMDDQFTDWHSVRPGHPTLSLSVREITSVSVTFILSSPYSASDPANPDLASLGLSSSDDDDQSRDSSSTSDTTQSQVVSDILAKGLSVKVNGTPWKRVILKMDDMLDEAVIILYGLMPARQYDIELGILPDQASVRSQITTDTEARSDTTHSESLPQEIVVGSDSTSVPLSSSPPQANGSTHSSNGHGPNQPTLEDRRLQLTHTLSILNAEHSSLTSTLKSARRESQKADAALRSEIDTLKRASDRHTAGENRARKKVLALQEAVKQTLAAARDIEALVKDIEAALPALEERKAAVEKEWTKVKDEAARVRARREEAEQREKARAEVMQVELAGLVNRLEKLSGKREKLEGEGGVLAELEERLRKLEEEREQIEKDPYGYAGEGVAESEDGSSSRVSGRDDSSLESDRPAHACAPGHSHGHPSHAHGTHAHPQPNFHPHPHQHGVHPRKRHSHPHLQHHPHQHHPRPSFPPQPRALAHHSQSQSQGQGPAGRGGTFVPGANHVVPGVIHLQSHAHPHKNYPNHHAPRNFRQQASSSSSSASATTPAGSATPLVNAGASTPGGSTLSSRAPPFEPSRSRAHSQSASSAAVKSDLNPGSTPFSPRAGVVQAVASAVGSSRPTPAS
ncbi:hypothetical protein C8Q74DRAFT_1045058 [Fomes fomentarius]|nr:hypothetical protein C8Q74DRAFT_1045058 [Fomes fomentarius]